MGLRIISFTDVHGGYKRVEEILKQEARCEAVIIGGDLTTFGSNAEATSAVDRFKKFGKPLLIVAGNMDPPELERVFEQQGVSINGSGVVIQEVGIFGASAAPFSPLHTPNEVSEEEILSRAEAGWKHVKAARWKLFVPHAPPFGTKVDVVHSGEHVGSTAVREFIERRQPDLVICGHIHEARGEDTIGRTKIVNCGPAGRGHHVIIEFNDAIAVMAR